MRVARSILRSTYKRQCYAREVRTTVERTTFNARNTISNRYTRKFSAITERSIANARNAVGDRYAR